MGKVKVNCSLFFSDEPCEQPEPISTVNRELVDFIFNKIKAAGYRPVDLAKRFSPKKPYKMQRHLDKFKETGQLPPSYMAYLSRELGFTLDEIQELERRHDQRIHRQRNLFVEHFDLIERYREQILDTPKWQNIVFHGMGFFTLWIGSHRPLTLGDLLILYRQGCWIADSACCGPVHIIYGSGSPFSGMRYYQGFCRSCHEMKYGYFSQFTQIRQSILDLARTTPYTPSRETVETLIVALLKQDGLWDETGD
jgi:hypothetical protein